MDLARTLQQRKAIHEVQSRFFEDADASEIFDSLLGSLLDLTDRDYGFIGEIMRRADGTPFLETHAITNVAWNDETRRFYEENAPDGLEFTNLETLFGAVIVTGEPMIANDPANDPRSGGLPPDHPGLDAFLGMPMKMSGELVGMYGVANREGGYDEELVGWIEPLTTRIGNLVHAIRAARQQRETVAALALSKHRFRSMWEARVMGVVVTDHEGSITEANDIALEIFGRSEDELPLPWTDVVDPNHHARAREAFALAAADGGSAGHEIGALRPDGSSTSVDVALAWLEDGSSLCFLKDRSAEQRIEEKIRQAEKMEAVGRLAGGIAHDFNNLLTVITGNADAWLEDAKAPKERHPAHQILEASDQAADLVRQLLDFSRGRQVSRVVVDLNETLLQRESMLKRLLRTEIELVVNLDPKLPPITAAPSEVEQILLNLAANARDAIATHGRIEIETRASGGDRHGAFLRFTDDGKGFGGDTRARIFEPFYTTKTHDRGTGLGLATVYSLIKRSGGEIHVDSTPGAGTTFEIWWPAAQQAANTRKRAPAAAIPTTPVRSLRILIVEDEPEIRRMLAHALVRAGHRVIEAADGPHALERSANETIDLLVSDVVMPGMRGPELWE